MQSRDDSVLNLVAQHMFVRAAFDIDMDHLLHRFDLVAKAPTDRALFEPTKAT